MIYIAVLYKREYFIGQIFDFGYGYYILSIIFWEWYLYILGYLDYYSLMVYYRE